MVTSENYSTFIEVCKNNSKTDAARILGVSRKTLYKWIKNLDLQDELLTQKEKRNPNYLNDVLERLRATQSR